MAPTSASSMGDPSIFGARRKQILKRRSGSGIEAPEAAAYGRPGKMPLRFRSRSVQKVSVIHTKV
jgi:hypothetical protein